MPDAPLPRPPRSCSPPPPAIFVSCSYGSRAHCTSGSEGEIGQPATIELQAKNIGNEQGENDKQTRKGSPVRPRGTRRTSAASTGDCLPKRDSRARRVNIQSDCPKLVHDVLQFVLFFNLYSQLIQLLFVYFAGGFGHQILGGCGLAKGNHFAKRLFAREQHCNTVDAQGDASMRRRSVCQGIKEKTKALAQLLLGQSEGFEHTFLDVFAVDSNAARAKLVTVQHEVVALRAHFPRHRFEFIQIVIHDSRERMLRADPCLVRVAPFEERKTGEPGKFPFCSIDLVQLFGEM